MASAIRCARAAGDLKYLSGSKSMVSIVMTVSSQALLQSLGPLYVACLFAFRAAGQHEHHGPAPYREIGAIARAMMNPKLADAISHRRVIAEETAPHPQQPLGDRRGSDLVGEPVEPRREFDRQTDIVLHVVSIRQARLVSRQGSRCSKRGKGTHKPGRGGPQCPTSRHTRR